MKKAQQKIIINKDELYLLKEVTNLINASCNKLQSINDKLFQYEIGRLKNLNRCLNRKRKFLELLMRIKS